ncbi:MAG: energy-coupling factor transporter transmembrane protein EcfT [Anaerolineae bacterium]|nr:energy-coupling factor transporter transmembrane protein EcfT [Anaerolineae bacterium]
MFHTLTSVLWLVAAAVPAFTLHNPLYLVLIVGASWIVYLGLGRASPTGRSWGTFVKIGVLFVAVAVAFNALSSHFGTLVLFRLPETWPIVGGPITLEAAIAGAVNGLGLLTILAVFATFNAVVDHYQLLRATPAFALQVGTVVSIAITFVPQMVLSAAEIRQAQRIRGHRFRGIRDLLPLVMPLLATSLERAIQLAETMEARGFATVLNPGSKESARLRIIVTQMGLLATLLGLLTGLFLLTFAPGGSAWGWGLLILSGGGMGMVLWWQGRQVRRTRYRRTHWQGHDTAVAIACAIVLATVIAGKLAAPQTLAYSPYPPNSLLPPFNPYVGAAVLLLALPAATRQVSASKNERATESDGIQQ